MKPTASSKIMFTPTNQHCDSLAGDLPMMRTKVQGRPSTPHALCFPIVIEVFAETQCSEAMPSSSECAGCTPVKQSFILVHFKLLQALSCGD
mmetsp:Transcript_91798/g.152049  ORF Transcript_91798/g.152049 Transcript_91798/m.152049 type:complete len:92 (-) Transcript_91798:175-450(-)